VDKPTGPTSHDVVARVRRALGIRAVGHTGTLDPFASGLLIVLVGRATRLARFVEQQDKTYLATARLGVRTTTDDLTGDVIADAVTQSPPSRRAAEPPSKHAVEDALAGFLGHHQQRPPAFSARRTGGERSYRLARRGIAVELPESPVVVKTIQLVEYDYPGLSFRTTVSAGTYVRALARDLGEALGIGAHLTALRREAIGALSVEGAVKMEAIGAETELLPPLSVLAHLPQVSLTASEAKAIGYGQAVQLSASPSDHCRPEEPVAATGEQQRLLAVGRVEGGVFRPEVVLEPEGS
jgi:tRNA pseudouridine55 synthase